jgi:hypothetical protein
MTVCSRKCFGSEFESDRRPWDDDANNVATNQQLSWPTSAGLNPRGWRQYRPNFRQSLIDETLDCSNHYRAANSGARGLRL